MVFRKIEFQKGRKFSRVVKDFLNAWSCFVFSSRRPFIQSAALDSQLDLYWRQSPVHVVGVCAILFSTHAQNTKADLNKGRLYLKKWRRP